MNKFFKKVIIYIFLETFPVRIVLAKEKDIFTNKN